MQRCVPPRCVSHLCVALFSFSDERCDPLHHNRDTRSDSDANRTPCPQKAPVLQDGQRRFEGCPLEERHLDGSQDGNMHLRPYPNRPRQRIISRLCVLDRYGFSESSPPISVFYITRIYAILLCRVELLICAERFGIRMLKHSFTSPVMETSKNRGAMNMRIQLTPLLPSPQDGKHMVKRVSIREYPLTPVRRWRSQALYTFEH